VALRVLLVEDDANDAELMRAYLAEAAGADAELLHVRSLGEGLRLLQSHEVHLTLLDLDLPDSTGFHTLERMRVAAAGPVIVVSGNGHPSLVEEVLKRRAYDVIPKHELDAATLRRILRLARLHYETGQTLRSTEGRFRALIENSNEALVLLDTDGRVEYASASMRRVLGFESAEALGRHGLLQHLEDARRCRGVPATGSESGREPLPRALSHKDGIMAAGEPLEPARRCGSRAIVQLPRSDAGGGAQAVSRYVRACRRSAWRGSTQAHRARQRTPLQHPRLRARGSGRAHLS
jgi:DNA-binding response OmpR family regulator